MKNDKSELFDYKTTEILIDCKSKYINTSGLIEWKKRIDKALIKFHKILNQADFVNGGDLTTENLNESFRLLKTISSNQKLNKGIYESIGIKEFNQKLRNLFYGKHSLAKRINDFIQLNNAGIQGTSQLLIGFNSLEFPISTNVTINALNLSKEILSNARDQSIKEYNIDNVKEYDSRTLKLLRNFYILKNIKQILDLEHFYQVNMILWKLSNEETEIDDREDDDIEDDKAKFTRFGYENDLRNYLSENIEIIEEGLEVVPEGVEYDTGQVGKIDLLCKDKKGNHLVIELKRDKSRDKVVGQILRYIGWVQENIDPNVRGLIILHESDEKLHFALKPVEKLIGIKYYKINFKLSDDP